MTEVFIFALVYFVGGAFAYLLTHFCMVRDAYIKHGTTQLRGDDKEAKLFFACVWPLIVCGVVLGAVIIIPIWAFATYVVFPLEERIAKLATRGLTPPER